MLLLTLFHPTTPVLFIFLLQHTAWVCIPYISPNIKPNRSNSTSINVLTYFPVPGDVTDGFSLKYSPKGHENTIYKNLTLYKPINTF